MRVNLPKLTPLGALLFGGGGQRMVSMGANGSGGREVVFHMPKIEMLALL